MGCFGTGHPPGPKAFSSDPLKKRRWAVGFKIYPMQIKGAELIAEVRSF